MSTVRSVRFVLDCQDLEAMEAFWTVVRDPEGNEFCIEQA